MVPAVARPCAAILLLSLASIFLPSQERSPSEEHVWLAVEEHPRGHLLIEPIATAGDSHLTPIQTSCLSDAESPGDFAAKYLESGRKYAVLFGGAYEGDGLLEDQNPNTHTATFAYTGTAKIRGQSRALATDDAQRTFRVASRTPATTEERREALTLAREIFSEHGVPQSILSKVEAEYVTRTYLGPSPLPSLIGSFTLDTGDTEGLLHSLFLIASRPGERLSPEFVWIHISESESDEEHLRFVDQADLFGDGQDEIVTKLISVGTQSHRYLILRRSRDGAHWEQIFRTEPLGCYS